MKNKLSMAISLAVILSLLLTSLALADGITADADALVLAPPSGNSFSATQSGATTVSYNFSAYIKDTGNSSDNVFASSSDSVIATITRSGAWQVGGSPSTSLTFTAYASPNGGTIDITVPCGSAGTTNTMTVLLSASATNGRGMSPNSATLSYSITAGPDASSCTPPPPSNTAPSVNVTGVTAGASYEIGSVPAAGCAVTDTEDGNSTFAATLSAVSGPLSAYGLGSQTASCSYTDGGGLSDSDAATYSIVDTTDPLIAFVSRTPANANGWNNGDVTVNWSCSDSGSGVVNAAVSQTVNTEGANQSATGTCEDHAGNTASDTQTGINIDKTVPTANASVSPAANANGWNNTDVTVSFTGNDGSGSGIASCSTAVVLNTNGAGQSASGTCTDLAGNVSAPATATGINIDKTAPTASASALPAANGNGWNNTDVTVSFSGNDGSGSGIASCSAAIVLATEGAGQSASGTCTDLAGNVSDPATASGINIDKTAPSVSLVGGPANGASYYFGSVPLAPTCSASDALSGLTAGGCTVSGYSNAVGTHTVSASATDKADNSASASAAYTVLGWTLNGFYQPVDMGGVYNTVRGGSTVPLKFEVFAGPTELTSTSVVLSFTQAQISCSGTALTDDIEVTTTGGTSLRYDTTGGQFVQNWQTPRQAGACYRVTMTTQDGSSLVAFFKLK